MPKKSRDCSNAKEIRRMIKVLKAAPICVKIKTHDGGYGGDNPLAGYRYYELSIWAPGKVQVIQMGSELQTGEFRGWLWDRKWYDYAPKYLKLILRRAKRALESRRQAELSDMSRVLKGLSWP